MEEMPGNGYSEEMSCKKSGEETILIEAVERNIKHLTYVGGNTTSRR